ncbi:alcohol dehydrogenase catalytic domain-containing protein [Streptococcus anginosus]|nr:alcohol dehydrogenase catalytic domain-containing protein [Streptococcus anginosus]MCW0998989.1 alcohol dehydrogenase catalytic domain-containing protein [Streptococcus anginosus]
MNQKMKAMVIYDPGGPEKFVLEERAIPNVKAGWTLVKIKGFGINHSEIVTRKGLSPTVQFPRILGIECVGQVVETTRRDLQEGQKNCFHHG